MLKIDIEKEKASIVVAGAMGTVICELTEAISSIYNQIREQDEMAGFLFQCGVKAVVTDKKSPVWANKEAPKEALRTSVVKDEKNVTLEDVKKIVDGGASMDAIRAFLEDVL